MKNLSLILILVVFGGSFASAQTFRAFHTVPLDTAVYGINLNRRVIFPKDDEDKTIVVHEKEYKTADNEYLYAPMKYILSLYDEYEKSLQDKFNAEFQEKLSYSKKFNSVEIKYHENGDIYFTYQKSIVFLVEIIRPVKPTFEGFIEYLRKQK